MPDEEPGIDWDEMRKASLNIAEVLWSFYAALIASGFDNSAALALTINYQTNLWVNQVKT